MKNLLSNYQQIFLSGLVKATQWRVSWSHNLNKSGEVTGHGEWMKTEKEAQDAVDAGNEEMDFYVKHWVEKR